MKKSKGHRHNSITIFSKGIDKRINCPNGLLSPFMYNVSRKVKLHGLTPMASTFSGFRQAEPCTEGHSSTPLRAWPSGAWVKEGNF